MSDRIPVEDLGFGVLDMIPVDSDWDSEGLMNQDWGYWEASDPFEVEGRDFIFIVQSGSSIAGAYTTDGVRIPMSYGSVDVDEMQCENCDGDGTVASRDGADVITGEGGTHVESDCPECEGTGNTAKLTDDQISGIEALDAYELNREGPMMNYRYPTGDSADSIGGWRHGGDAVDIAYRLRDTPLCLVDYDGVIALALTGGGMDLTWEIVEAFTLLGYLPPVHFGDLPRMAGRGTDERDRYLIAAVERSLTAMVDKAKSQLGYHRERWGLPNADDPTPVKDAVLAAFTAAHGDSNDGEIEALQDALELALARWPEVDADAIREQVSNANA